MCEMNEIPKPRTPSSGFMSKQFHFFVAVLAVSSLGCREATRSEQVEPSPLVANSMEDISRLFAVGMSTNDIIGRFGSPDFHVMVPGGENWTYSVTPFVREGADDYKVIGIVLFVTNGTLAGWDGFYASQEKLANPATEKILNSGSNIPMELNFHIVHDSAIPSGRLLNTPRYPNLGYISAKSDFSVRQIRELTLSEKMDLENNSERKSWELYFVLNVTDADGFERLTESSLGKKVAIMIGDEMIAAPTIQYPIMNGTFTVQFDDRIEFEMVSKKLGLIESAVR
jgi:hypothetical protein